MCRSSWSKRTRTKKKKEKGEEKKEERIKLDGGEKEESGFVLANKNFQNYDKIRAKNIWQMQR